MYVYIFQELIIDLKKSESSLCVKYFLKVY